MAAVAIGSKAFTEGVILGEIATQAVQHAGIAATHRAQLGGTQILWRALDRGEIAAYAEYTGTLREEIFAARKPRDRRALAAALAQHDIAMTAPLGFDDTYAIGMRDAVAESLGIRTIDDLAQHPGLRCGFSNEFLNRGDGWPGLRTAYHLPLAHVRGLDHELAYRGLIARAVDITDLYSTDAEIRQYGLRVLTDDRHYFPQYQAVFLYRRSLIC